MVVRGELSGEADVRLGGELEGKVNLTGTVVILEGARIQGDIAATDIVVAGAIHGNLMASDKVELSPTGRLAGDIRSKVVVVREGGKVSGRIMVGTPASPSEELAELAEQVRQEEARDLWRSR